MTQPLDSLAFPLTGNRLIEASAGTGKTYTITNLYLRLLLGRDIARPLAVNEILVLTFTIAATQELRARIRTRIADARAALVDGRGSEDAFLAELAASSSDPEGDTRLLSAALQLMDEASIFTIHAFCARVLSDNAFETGTLFDQDLDADRDILLQTAVEDCFRATLLTLPDLAREVALDTWGSPDALLSAVKPYLFRFNLTLLPPETDMNELLDSLLADIAFARRQWLADDLPSIIRNAGLNGRSRPVTWLDAMTGFCEGQDLSTDLWENWTTSYMQARLNKGQVLPRHPVLDAIDRIWSALDQLHSNLWHLVTRTVLENLSQYKVQLSQLTLDDLLIRVYESLEAPGAGERLARDLATRWPAAMIDEFQDTDDVQYGIFDLIYGRTDNQGLFFIGDPKQAIYQFRGADVFSYINARRRTNPSSDIFSLDTNWRSTPGIVNAINTLFHQEEIFDNDEDIPYEPVKASGGAEKKILYEDGRETKPAMLYQVANEDGLNVDQAVRLSMDFAAEETVRLLAAARNGHITIEDKPLHAGNIAFLVRSRRDARAAREALNARNVKSVYVTLESVFLTDTAEDLKIILEAVIAPGNLQSIKAALAVPLMQTTASEIAALAEDLDAQMDAYHEFMEYHELWAKMDIAPMIERLMFKRRIAQKWFGRNDGERQVTNVRHLAELLQQRSAVAPGMHRLLKWFVREKLAAETVAAEDRQLRLESDRDLVQIVTMHASKGLEYDVVMIPMAGFTGPKETPPYLFHESRDGEFHTLLDFAGDEDNLEAAQREMLAEDMRLLYVAITRARSRCYIGLPNIKDLPRTALAKLLRIDNFEASTIEAHLNASLPATLFDIRTVTDTTLTRLENVDDIERFQRPAERPEPDDHWQVHSYTGVSRLIRLGREDAATQPDAAVIPGYADDDEASDTGGDDRRERIDRFTFPRGPRAGVALHTLMENLDFDEPVTTQSREIDRCLDRVGITRNRDEWYQVLASWCEDILRTPLPSGCSLDDVSRRNRLDEMEFHFPLGTDARFIGLLQEHGYLPHASGLSADALAGVMTGLIDLVFEHDGRYWLVDYKSNHLGETTYGEPLMREAVEHHQYDLQYLIYCVALIRYLKSRLPGFDYDKHFGGVCYLFIRGMNGSDDAGIYFDRPREALISALDEALGDDD